MNDEEGQVNVVLRDVLGKMYYSKMLQLGRGSNLLQISRDNSIPAGIYFITVTNTNKIFTQRIVVH
jgi:hypothetical protein